MLIWMAAVGAALARDVLHDTGATRDVYGGLFGDKAWKRDAEKLGRELMDAAQELKARRRGLGRYELVDAVDQALRDAAYVGVHARGSRKAVVEELSEKALKASDGLSFLAKASDGQVRKLARRVKQAIAEARRAGVLHDIPGRKTWMPETAQPSYYYQKHWAEAVAATRGKKSS